MLTVASYLWFDPRSKQKYTYGPDDVRLLKRMVDRHLTLPHEFVCITDQPRSFSRDEGIRAVAIDNGAHVPSRIFAKLMTFHPEAGELIGRRILTLDLDCVITGNLDALVDRDEDLVLWRNPSRVPWDNPEGKGRGRSFYNSSMVLIRAGVRPDIWTEFRREHAFRHDGDQDWMSAKVGPDCPYWDRNDGVYRLAREDTPGSGVGTLLPANARIVHFPGSEGKPWAADVQAKCPWIASYRQ